MHNKHISNWLFICCFMVAVMVFVGGLTRLTDSGLSMTDWHPIHGILPPLNEREWVEEFYSYQQSPEYQKKNFGMGLQEFKSIFMWEYIHRMLGRLVGLIFLLPLLFFWMKKQFSKKEVLKLFAIFSLGGVQGFIGWYMVKSGLVDRPDVSQYRLALHLGVAFILFGLLWLQAWKYRDSNNILEFKNKCGKFCAMQHMALILLFIQIIFGALVAGLNAGLTYNTWPMMDGDFVPQGIFIMQPWWINFFENTATIQFTHRWLAFLVVGLVLFISIGKMRSFDKNQNNRPYIVLLVILFAQIMLGILTLINQVPIILASAHQMIALALWANLLYVSCVNFTPKVDH